VWRLQQFLVDNCAGGQEASEHNRLAMARARKTQSKKALGVRRVKTATTPADQKRAIEHLTVEEVQEAQFLHGLVDPDYPARGPAGAGNAGTFLVTLTAEETLTFTAAANRRPRFPLMAAGQVREAGQDGEWDGAAVISVNHAYALDSDSSVAIVLQPQAIVRAEDSSGDASNATMSGFTWPTNVTTGTPFLTNDSSVTSFDNGAIVPLGEMATPFPGQQEKTTLNNATSEFMVGYECAVRCVGLIAEMTVVQPALDAQGAVWAGNNQDFAMMANRSVLVRATGSAEESLFSSDQEIQAADYSFSQVEKFAHIVPTGAFSNGSKHVAHWLPVGDNCLAFQSARVCQPGAYVADTTDPQSTALSPAVFLANSEGCVFVLKGLNTTSSLPAVNIKMRANYEVILRRSHSIAWNIAEARLNRRFFVDWSELAGLAPGAGPGDLAYMSVARSDKVAAGRVLGTSGVDTSRHLHSVLATTPTHATEKGSKASQIAHAAWGGIKKLGSFAFGNRGAIGSVAAGIGSRIGGKVGGALTGLGSLLRWSQPSHEPPPAANTPRIEFLN
jgi:hypothetical protein